MTTHSYQNEDSLTMFVVANSAAKTTNAQARKDKSKQKAKMIKLGLLTETPATPRRPGSASLKVNSKTNPAYTTLSKPASYIKDTSTARSSTSTASSSDCGSSVGQDRESEDFSMLLDLSRDAVHKAEALATVNSAIKKMENLRIDALEKVDSSKKLAVARFDMRRGLVSGANGSDRPAIISMKRVKMSQIAYSHVMEQIKKLESLKEQVQNDELRKETHRVLAKRIKGILEETAISDDTTYSDSQLMDELHGYYAEYQAEG